MHGSSNLDLSTSVACALRDMLHYNTGSEQSEMRMCGILAQASWEKPLDPKWLRQLTLPVVLSGVTGSGGLKFKIGKLLGSDEGRQGH